MEKLRPLRGEEVMSTSRREFIFYVPVGPINVYTLLNVIIRFNLIN